VNNPEYTPEKMPEKMPEQIAARMLSVDLEDYFQVAVMNGAIPIRYWPRLERRLDTTIQAWIDALAQTKCSTATFFVSPWAVRMHPNAIRHLATAGHEIAALGLFESRPSGLPSQTLLESRSEPRSIRDAPSFLGDVRALKVALEALIGRQVAGFRLARGAMSSAQLQAITDAGFAYDSSTHDVDARLPSRLRYAVPITPRQATRNRSGIGAAWFEFAVSHAKATPASTQSVVRYIAPDLDPAQPRITALSVMQQRRQYHELFRRAARLNSELSETRSTSIAQHLKISLANLAPPATTLDPSAVVPRMIATTDARHPITLVVPCCNEAETIGYLANTLARFEEGAASDYRVHYVFVDDGSTDDTFDALCQHFGDKPDAQIIQHDGNKGVAAATMTGVAHAPTELVGVIDCDCSYDPAEVMRMVPLMQAGIALVTASPYHPDGQVVNVPAWRLWLSQRLSQLYRMTLKTPLHTYTACVRLYRKSAVEGLTIRHGNYLGIAEILARLDQNGASIVESPAVLEARILGHSKMKIVRTSIGHIGLLSELMVARVLRRLRKQPDKKTIGVRT
jgi:hypothetical protein